MFKSLSVRVERLLRYMAY